jgi:hypothetical protein
VGRLDARVTWPFEGMLLELIEINGLPLFCRVIDPLFNPKIVAVKL